MYVKTLPLDTQHVYRNWAGFRGLYMFAHRGTRRGRIPPPPTRSVRRSMHRWSIARYASWSLSPPSLYLWLRSPSRFLMPRQTHLVLGLLHLYHLQKRKIKPLFHIFDSLRRTSADGCSSNVTHTIERQCFAPDAVNAKPTGVGFKNAWPRSNLVNHPHPHGRNADCVLTPVCFKYRDSREVAEG